MTSSAEAPASSNCAVPSNASGSFALIAQANECFSHRDWNTALERLNVILCADNNDLQALNLRARALEALNRLPEALADVEKAEALEPGRPTHRRNRGNILLNLNRPEEALRCFDDALADEPNDSELLSQRAYALLQLSEADQALRSATRALEIDHTNLDARRAQSLALEMLDRPLEAVVGFELVARRRPNGVVALNDLGRLLVRLGRFDEAVRCYDRSQSLDPNSEVTRYNRCMARLASGDWTQGLKEFEIRWKIAPPQAIRPLSLAPQWSGQEDVNGKTILLHHEQGYGDTLQFARYAPAVAGRGGRVLLAVPTGLRTLMHSLKGPAQILSEGDPIPRRDFMCPLMSLPAAFGTTLEMPMQLGAYLHADSLRVRHWGERLGAKSRMRIGLVWCGRRQAPINAPRDIELSLLRPLLSLPADIISLQKELSEADREVLVNFPAVRRLGEEVSDFADTAALIEHLDLVIAVDSAVAHLAGALGKPVWLLNRLASCWRWGQRGTVTPWYSSMRIFRQSRFGDWPGVVDDVVRAANLLIRHLQSGSTRAPTLLGQAQTYQSAGHEAEAATLYRHLLTSDPPNAGVWQLAGVAYARQKVWADAAACFRVATEIAPWDAGAFSNLGNALAADGRLQDALTSYQKALQIDPTYADAHYNRATLLHEQGRDDEALDAFNRAIALNPHHAEAYNNRGNVLGDLRRFAEARDSYSMALAIRGDFSDALINRSVVSRRLHRYREALLDCGQVLAVDPKSSLAYCNRGAALAAAGEYAGALRDYDRALALNANHAEALWNKSLLLLLQGRYEEGWSLYEHRWNVKSLQLKRPPCMRASWTGREPLAGRTLLLQAEQGYGDILQFCRFASLAAASAARVLLQVPSVLLSLLRSLPQGVEVLSQEPVVPDFDLQCPLMSLPAAFGTRLDTIPAQTPYLHADTARRAAWRHRLGDRGRPRIGLAWTGKPTHSNDAKRSVPLEQLRPLLGCDAHFVALQKDIGAADRKFLQGSTRVQLVDPYLTDFADTAALIAELDLVISVDTCIAHLAGALGKPLWVLLPRVPDWRWLLERDDSPWYPTAKLFRQKFDNRWSDVIARVCDTVQRLGATETGRHIDDGGRIPNLTGAASEH